ncbi:hypothetical protein BJX63DRAFT_393974 [Aspergillus granulosus]|uniref:Ubiquitin-like domain-containing protein n=1 Tax=Aspergillus granulosus TaxID=176169 RepID=A0ABR4HDN6_9EURO
MRRIFNSMWSKDNDGDEELGIENATGAGESPVMVDSGLGPFVFVEPAREAIQEGHQSSTDAGIVRVKFKNLKYRLILDYYGTQPSSLTLNLPAYTLVSQLGEHLLREQPDLKPSKHFHFPKQAKGIEHIWRDIFTTPVEVISANSVYDRHNLKIHRDETIASFMSKAFSHPLELAPFSISDATKSTSSKECISSIALMRCDRAELLISFRRTLQRSDQSKDSNSSPEPERVPLFDTRSVSHDLPPTFPEGDGFLLPMHPYEAMSIHIGNWAKQKTFAVKLFNRSLVQDTTTQWDVACDYKARKVQLQIIPELDTDGMYASTTKDLCSCTSFLCLAHKLDVLKTPAELGFKSGDLFHVKVLRARSDDRELMLADLLEQQPLINGCLELKANYEHLKPYTLNARAVGTTTIPVTLTFDEYDDFEDALMVLNDRLGVSNGTLHAENVIENAPDVQLPICRWEDLELCEKIRAHRIEKGKAGQNRLDLLLMPENTTSLYVCCVYWMDKLKPSLIALDSESTMHDLRKEVNKLQGNSSTADWLLEPLDLDTSIISPPSHADDNKNIFSDLNTEGKQFPEFMWMPSGQNTTWIRIVTLIRGQFWLQCDLNHTFNDLKLMIEEQQDIPAEKQRFIFRGKGLLCHQKLSDYGIATFSTLHLVLRLSGDGPTFWVNYGTQQLSFRWISIETALDLKNAIAERIHVPPIRHALLYEDKEVQDETPLNRYTFKCFTLRILPEDKSPALQFDAAGGLIQSTEPETSNPRLLDEANPVMLNLYIMNDSTFRSLTGLE